MSKISKGRKITYYIGIGMIVLGFMLFISVFFSFAGFISSPNSSPFTGGGPSFKNSVIGMVLIAAGFVVMNIGARGPAGSGVLLDPEKARENLKPFNEAKGGMINDVVSNIDAVQSITGHHQEKKEIKIKCRSCGTLNDEDAKYCKGCGEKL